MSAVQSIVVPVMPGAYVKDVEVSGDWFRPETEREEKLAAEIAALRPRHKFDFTKKVAICGFASSSRNLAPFDDKSFEIWGMNSLYALIPRFDRWFEIHPKDHFKKDLNRGELITLGLDHYQWLKSQPGPGQEGYKPIYMQEAFPDIPASLRWPREEINAWSRGLFGAESEVDYFTSTPAQMLLSAIVEGYGEIHLYGIDLLQDEEYAYQRPGCEYWIGVARGLGARVVVPRSSALLKANYVYGYSEPMVEFGSLTPLVKFAKDKGDQAEKAQQQLASVLNTINGARQIIAALRKRDGADEAFLATEDARLEKQFNQGIAELNKVGGQREVLTSMASWIAHFGRGGTLEGM